LKNIIFLHLTLLKIIKNFRPNYKLKDRLDLTMILISPDIARRLSACTIFIIITR